MKAISFAGKVSAVLLFAALSGVVFSLSSAAAESPKKERLAVAEPETHNGIDAQEIAGISNYLESRVGGPFEIYSRTALKAILKEHAFNESGMVADEDTKNELDLKGIKYLLSYNVSKIGGVYRFTMQLVNASTGRIDPDRRAAFDVKSLRMLYGRIDQSLKKMGMFHGEGDEAKRIALLPVSGNSLSQADGEAIAGKLTAILSKSGAFTMTDRADLDKVAAESLMAEAELAAPGQAVKVGQINVADYIVIVKVPRFENRKKASGSEISGFSGEKIISHIGVTVKAVEVATGEVKCAGDLSMVVESTEFPAEERRNWTLGDYNNALFDRVAAAVSAMLLEKLDPVYVAAVEDGNIYLTCGRNTVSVGDVFEVFNPGKEIVHPVTKKKLGTAERFAGRIRVVEAGGDLAVARAVNEKENHVSVGGVCRNKTAAAKPDTAPDPVYPMAQ